MIIECKAIDAIAPVHTAQVMTYLRLSEKQLGILINFNVPLLKEGYKRIVL
ncbi:MAG: GxxExxY protein [Bacteroidota bacterium]